jgi:cytochrome c peroxidase
MRLTGTISLIIFFFAAFLYTASCRKKEMFSATPLNIVTPSGFPQRLQFINEELTVERVELGKKLFYEKQLSKDGSISCAGCHQQIAAFGTYDHDLSHGLNGEHSNRNAPPLFNLLWASSFGWDGRYKRIEDIAAAHITNPVYFGETINGVLAKLNGSSTYSNLFKKAYGSAGINKQNLLNALAQFTVTMVSTSTKYDSVKQNLISFTNTEQAGYELFQSKCSFCHKEPLFNDHSYRNIGLPFNNTLNDKGRMDVTGNRNDSLKFRVPSLRNLFFSFPFMHDGRFVAFSQVFDHYKNGIQPGFTVDPFLTGGILLNTPEQNALLEFLKTLSDSKFVKDARYMQ